MRPAWQRFLALAIEFLVENRTIVWTVCRETKKKIETDIETFIESTLALGGQALNFELC